MPGVYGGWGWGEHITLCLSMKPEENPSADQVYRFVYFCCFHPPHCLASQLITGRPGVPASFVPLAPRHLDWKVAFKLLASLAVMVFPTHR